jgi:hypothetical protein
VSWTPPQQENGVLLNYSISWINDFENRSASVGNTEYIITFLEPCVDYFINVKAQTLAGYGPPGFATATTQTDGKMIAYVRVHYLSSLLNAWEQACISVKQ